MKRLCILAAAWGAALTIGVPLATAQQSSPPDVVDRLKALWPPTAAPMLPLSAGTAPEGPAGADTVPSSVGMNLAWTRDEHGFFYTSTPHPTQLYYHWTKKHQPDLLVYESPDGPTSTVRADMSSEGEYVIITVTHQGDPHTRLEMIDLDDAGHPTISAPVVKVYDDLDAAYHYAGSYNNTLFVLTDRDAPRGKILSVDATDPRHATERTALAEGAEPLVYAHAVATRLFTAYREAGTANDVVRVMSLQGFQVGTVPLPAMASVDQIAWGGRQDKDTAYVVAESVLLPPVVFAYGLRSAQTTLAHGPAITFDSTQYQMQMLWYDSTGNLRKATGFAAYVAMRKGTALDGSHRVWVDTASAGTGGLRFSPAAIVWMDQGGVYIVPGTQTAAARSAAVQFAIGQKYGTTGSVFTDAAPPIAAGVDSTATWLARQLH